MAFEFADIFFGSHQKREGIPTPADGAVRIYKKVGKSFTTSGFFKKSSDIFFGATSQKKHSARGAFSLYSLPDRGADILRILCKSRRLPNSLL